LEERKSSSYAKKAMEMFSPDISLSTFEKQSITMVGRTLSKLLVTYLIASLVLSIVIVLRQISPSIMMNFLNAIFYDLFFYLMSVVMFGVLLKSRDKKNRRNLINRLNTAVYSIIFLFIIIFFDCLPLIPFFIKYLLFLSPLFALSFLLIYKGIFSIRKRTLLLVCIIAIVIIPYISAYAAYRLILFRVSSISNTNDRIVFLSDHSTKTVLSIWRYKNNFLSAYITLHRFQDDFQKYLFVGTGGCGELASVVKKLLSDLSITARKVGFVGENHEFLEVNISGSWEVVDPGYHYNLISRKERGTLRLREMGGLSYVIAYTDYGIVEVTDSYVPTDTIVIRVTIEGEPVANARVVLKHIFKGLEQSLPEYYTDVNGTVILKIGPTSYKSDLKNTENYYWIFVNGISTGQKVKSSGSGSVRLIEIKLEELLD